MASTAEIDITSSIEFEHHELQLEARTIACLKSLPKVHNEKDFYDYFTETFNAACHNQGLADKGSEIWAKFELPGPPSFTMHDVTALTNNTTVYIELQDIYTHAQIAEAWLSRVIASHRLNKDAEDGDEEVHRAFRLLHDVESFPLLEDFCNEDKKNWEMVRWIMQPMVKVLQEGSIQLYLINRRKWYIHRGDSELARERLALPPGLAKRGRCVCPAIPAVWFDRDDDDNEGTSTTESVDTIEPGKTSGHRGKTIWRHT